MRLFEIEHSGASYAADFLIYGTFVAGLAVALLIYTPRVEGVAAGILVIIGFVSWTTVEYFVHRFVLHGLEPFRSWHMEHHRRPTALICAPTMVSVALIALLIFMPALAFFDASHACGFTLGFVFGYLVYAVAHHGIHHWRSPQMWLLRRKRWHARHHHSLHACGYGVTTSLWDHLFKTAP